jgi:mRNA-degrading endonuclease toxin of MazEF toxin-antitoxin module
VTPQPRRGQIWTIAGDAKRRVLVYSGNMFNELPDVPYVITMDVVAESDPMDVELPDGSRVAYTRLDNVPKSLFGEVTGEVPAELIERINTRLFMVITTQ